MVTSEGSQSSPTVRREITLADQLDDKARIKMEAALELADLVANYLPITALARDKSARPLRAVIARYNEAAAAENVAWTRWDAFQRSQRGR
jgi:hypothetical protein